MEILLRSKKTPESLSNLWKRPLKTTNISLFSSRKSKNLAFSCDRDNKRTALPHALGVLGDGILEVLVRGALYAIIVLNEATPIHATIIKKQT